VDDALLTGAQAVNPRALSSVTYDMQIRSFVPLILVLALAARAILRPTTLAAQSGGPYAPVVLTLPSGPRTLAMGNVGIGSRDDDVLFFNPAQLAVARGTSASGERYSATANGGTVSAVTRLGNGGVAVGMRMVDYKTGFVGFPADRSAMLVNAGLPGTSLEAMIGLAQVIKGVRIGATAKYASDDASNVEAHRAAVDLGISKDFRRYFTAGLAVQNLSRPISFSCVDARFAPECGPPPGVIVAPSPAFPTAKVYLPLRTTAGIAGSGPVGPLDISGTAAVSLLRDSFVIPAGGGEVSYSWLDGYAIALRAGARRPIPGEGPFTGGVGFTMDRLSIDYAIEALSGSRVGHRIGLRIR
jgi:hypothetical protein